MFYQAHRFFFFLVSVGALGLLSVACGQTTPNAQIRSEQIQRQVTPSLQDDIASLPGVEDFGEFVVLKKTKLWDITPFASARGFWTSNALLQDNGGVKGDAVFVIDQGVDAGYRITSDWQVRAGYDYQLTRYRNYSFLDTDAHSANFQTIYQAPWDFQLTAGLRGLWLNSPYQPEEIYRENNPFGILSQSHSYLQDRLTWYYGYQFDRKWTNPVGFDRDEHSVFTGVSYAWTPQLVSALNLRQNWQFYDFRPPPSPVNGRQEWVSTVSLITVWQPLNWLQISSFALGSYDNSVNASGDYRVVNAGGEIRVFWQF